MTGCELINVRVFAIQRREAPESVGGLQLPGDIGRVAVSGDDAYVYDGVGLWELDSSDVVSPRTRHMVGTSGTASWKHSKLLVLRRPPKTGQGDKV